MKKIVFMLSVIILIAACKKDGGEVVKLPFSKSEYTLLKAGKGTKSKLGDYILFSLLVKSQDGTVLADRRDSTAWGMDKVVELDSNTIPLAEMLYSMKLGDSSLYTMVMTPEQKGPGMENIDTVFYYMKLERIMDEATMKKEQEKKDAEAAKKAEEMKLKSVGIVKQAEKLRTDFLAGALKGKTVKTPSGLEYMVVEKGKGPKVLQDDFVSVAYHGIFEKDGKIFDSSFERGNDIQFNAGQGQMIKGWDEAMLHLNVGDKSILFVPYPLAYGEEGRPPQIPAKANLVFFIEVISAKKVK
jgi:FKBP-type peptidyl-prolyl cis-trans isomerase